ncbi:MAG TPA: MFS transporter [Polyangiaceae bacterium]|nr:MFS transporter [Polyangiaceae bacterium]
MSDQTRRRNVVWAATWLAYASYYLGRKTFSSAKHSLEAARLLDVTQLGYIDSGYLGAYALGQFLNGMLGDRVGARRLVGFGLMASAGLCALFGASSSALLLMLLFTLNGVAQATGWPGVTRAMTEWTTPQNRGTVMGFWSTCYQAGPLLAGPFAGMLIHAYGWRAAFQIPAAIMIAVGLLVLALVRPGPTPAGAAPAQSEEAIAERRAAQREVVRNRVLWSYGASYFCIKFMRYALQLWLPYYLQKRLGYADDMASYVAAAFEAGGLVGVVSIGVLSDRRWGRVGLSTISLLLLAVAMFACAMLVGASLWLNVALLALLGAFLFAPDSILCGAAAQDAGGSQAASMATGFVNGLGSFGALLVGLMVPKMAQAYGWSALFPCLVGVALLGAACLLPALRRPLSARVHA